MSAGGAVLLLACVVLFIGFRACFGSSTSSRSTTASRTSRPHRTPLQSTHHTKAYGDTILKDDELTDFLAFLIEDTNDVWDHELDHYAPVKMVLFEGSTSTGCGRRNARGGPAYCPKDKKMYVPPSFYGDLSKELGAPGDFAEAIVVAHEAGHHVQLGLGISAKMYEEIKRHPTQAQELKIRHELQADCFAGIWAHSVQQRGLLEVGDVDEALQAAAAIGDDALQRHAGIPVNDKKWSHGSSAMRVRWFKKGLRSGTLASCDTFAAKTL